MDPRLSAPSEASTSSRPYRWRWPRIVMINDSVRDIEGSRGSVTARLLHFVSVKSRARCSPRLFRLDQLERAVFQRHQDSAAVLDVAEQQQLRQRLLDRLLDQARHGPRAEGAVEAL